MEGMVSTGPTPSSLFNRTHSNRAWYFGRCLQYLTFWKKFSKNLGIVLNEALLHTIVCYCFLYKILFLPWPQWYSGRGHVATLSEHHSLISNWTVENKHVTVVGNELHVLQAFWSRTDIVTLRGGHGSVPCRPLFYFYLSSNTCAL